MKVRVAVGWLIGVPRHKLADHWRWQARQQRLLAAVGRSAEVADDPWDATLDLVRAHRLVLILRYLDGLSVPETAAVIDRTVHATEALLVIDQAQARGFYTAVFGWQFSAGHSPQGWEPATWYP